MSPQVQLQLQFPWHRMPPTWKKSSLQVLPPILREVTWQMRFLQFQLQELVGTTNIQTTDGALYGKIAGANIRMNSGAPGGGVSIQLRGISTLTGASQPSDHFGWCIYQQLFPENW
jgi:hypothetical protein